MDKPAVTDVALHPLLAKRWSPRAFDASPIDPKDINALLEAARWAPSCFNAQPWAFLLATREDEAAHKQMVGCLVEGNQTWAKNAPLLMVGLARKTFEHNDKPNNHARHDLGLAAAQLTIEATARDLYVHQMAGIQSDKIRDVYQVPDEWDIVTGIAIGKMGNADDLSDDMAEREKAERSRKPRSAFVFKDRFGQAAE